MKNKLFLLLALLVPWYGFNMHIPITTPVPTISLGQSVAPAHKTRDENGSIVDTKEPARDKRPERSIKSAKSAGKRAIIIGASSGMGREVAKLLAADGYSVGLAARRLELLEKTREEIFISTDIPTYSKKIDVSEAKDAGQKLEDFIHEMGGMDLLVISVTGNKDVDVSTRDWTSDLALLNVDVVGFFALARTGLTFFEKQGHGHLVGFSSIDGLRGTADSPTYSAAKAFCSRYLEAERNRCVQKNIPITVTEIIPGWVNSNHDTDISKDPKTYWVESLTDASQAIFRAIKNKVPVAYITERWQKVADLLKVIPDDLYNALSARPGGGF